MKVLLAGADPERSARLFAQLAAAHLGAAGAAEVVHPRPGEALLDAVAREAPDVVLVDMGRPDRDALDDLRHLTRHDPRPVVVFVDQDDPAFMQDAIDAGVSSYNVVGAAPPDVKPIIQSAVALFRRFRGMEAELRRAEASLTERAVIDRAKALLMRTRRMTEPDAYRWLRRQAMDGGRRIADVAAALIAAQENTP